jgi:hypothetical protein
MAEILYGYVSKLEKKIFFADFKSPDRGLLRLRMKRQLLTLPQKSMLAVGSIVKLDFETKKIYFKQGLTEWV